jgi:hypothetical protein
MSRFLSGDLAPGLYVCKTRMSLYGEDQTFGATFKFAVDR